ncbi:integrase-like protein [Luteimonas cucumeris]|uniref:Integrase-like protein n=1 Tax=Luteimonas cucumeris TaxID=985012 RepID=A0A562KVG7_9GAMM|nr:helix-turn-helix domain-containing protein [Luteimonas cucumeris]TWH99411.1 integrase-like protein [Luteimonas cucumeris]
MNDEHLEVRQRLALLELAQSLGNVAEACRRSGVTRTQYYQYRRRHDRHGPDGLRNLPPIARTHPGMTPAQVIERTAALALAHPGAGCNRLEQLLRDEGLLVSGVTIQKHLGKLGLGSRAERCLALQQRIAEGLAPSAEQMAFVERCNPAFRERGNAPSRPGESLSQDTMLVGQLRGVGRLYLHGVVDTFSQYAFALLHNSKRAEAAITVLFGQALPFFEGRGLTPRVLQTSGGREFCGGPSHPYELFLMLNGIVHERPAAINGHTQRFHEAVKAGFAREAFRDRDQSMADVQAKFGDWLRRYNADGRCHQGYPNQGLSPVDVLQRPAPAAGATGGG